MLWYDNCGDETTFLIQEWDSKSEKHSVLPTSAAVTASDVVPGSIRTEGTQQEPRPDENKVKYNHCTLRGWVRGYDVEIPFSFRYLNLASFLVLHHSYRRLQYE